jgi:tRNA-splicing ligase RtcB
MKARELNNLGLPRGPVMKTALKAMGSASMAGLKRTELRKAIRALVQDPAEWMEHPQFGKLAGELLKLSVSGNVAYVPRDDPAPYEQWGADLEGGVVDQMRYACQLPVSVAGALMPDAHVGYGLPIGGVLATDNAVIPYAVGVDIACRMKLSVLDLPVDHLDRHREALARAIEKETRFGVGATFKSRRDHDVMDEDWSVTKITHQLQDKAWSQLGTSGSGNHFVEFGELTLEKDELGLQAGKYTALLSHGGSRGAGAVVAGHYSRLAMSIHQDLPKELKHLAWLDLDTEAGMEYWQAMHLMGKYAAANHACIHRHVVKHLKAGTLVQVENHHNYAWKEVHGGREVVVHRKGATPAGAGVMGIIPGSMGDPGYVVRGRGNTRSLESASHGAGRRMSRKQAARSFTWNQTRKYLQERGVTLLSAGLDESPMAYKNIEVVMSAQQDLVETVARFDPRLVKMAPAGERPED